MSIERFLASHDGVVSRAQARACGLTDDQIAHRVASGEWIRRAPAVYFAVAWVWSACAAVRVVAEWTRPVGTLAETTAAWWLGLGVETPYPLTVIMPRGCSRSPPRAVRITQRDLSADRVLHRELWVTSTALTVLDAAVALGRGGQPFLDRALQRHVSLDELRAAQNRHLGRRGSAAAGRLIARAGDHAASEPERHMIALLRRAGITGWSVNREVTLLDGRRAILDVAFADLRLAIEVDGWAHHVDHDSFVGGRARKRALVAEGWIVVEVTAEDLLLRPEATLADIRRILLRLATH